MDLANRVVAGDQRAIARAISVVETDPARTPALIKKIFGHTGRARVIGVTGAPGVGKSTLVDRLATEYRRLDLSVGILAVDPSSPFSGGAILGDRIRMQRHTLDDGVYVRSMATHGHLGGLSDATSDAVLVLDAAGRQVVLVETVGVGQAEVEIARTADVSVVVTIPDAGDDVQAMKAGIMEIADVFVVNKADHQGADRTAGEIDAMLSLQEFEDGVWRPPVVKTQATTGEGVSEVVDAVQRFCDERHDTRDRRRERAAYRLTELLRQGFVDRLRSHERTRALLDDAVARITEGAVDPYTAAAGIMEHVS